MAVELKAIATLDGKPFEMTISKMGNNVDRLKTGPLAGLKGMIAGAFTVGAIVSFGRKLLQTADTLVTTAKTFDITTESMLALKTASAESGISVDKLFKSLSKLKDAQGQVIGRNETMIGALKALNISEEEFVGLGVDVALLRVGEAYMAAQGSAEAFSAVVDFFGQREAKDMIEVFQRMHKEGFEKFKQDSKDAAKGIEELAKASDLLEKAGNKFIIWSAKVVSALSAVAKESKTVGEMPFFKREGIIRMTGRKLGEAFGAKNEDILGERTKTGMEARKLIESIKLPPGMKRTPAEEAEAIKGAIEILKGGKPAEEENINQKKLEAAKRAEAVKGMDEALRADEKRQKKEDDFNEAQDKLAEEVNKKREDIMEGKGIAMPERARVDALQAIGGIIGGVAGRGDQAARIAERQASATEATRDLVIESNRKLDEIYRKFLDVIIE